MARLQFAALPASISDLGFLLVIDLVDAARLDSWHGTAAQLKVDTGCLGVIITDDRLDVTPEG